VIGLRYVYFVGELLLAVIFLVAVIAGIRSLLWKVIWPVAAGCLWYFAGPFFAAPLMILVILRIATTVAASAQTLPGKDSVSPTV
jgi:beta-lactamase regulating signal transducer with metallopeptidase domain